jgi:uncharacterized RDD family membrane protein YckC
MRLHCSRCHRVLEFTGDRPSFCAYCGFALTETNAAPPTPVDADATTLARQPPAPVPEAAPEFVGGYRLLRVLGGGAMGTVYEAEDAASGRRVALKLIAPDYAGSADAVERFRQEGRLASAIAHPRCVFVYAADEDAGRPYIVMELMPGPTLQDLVDGQGPLPPEEAVGKLMDVIEGLQEAHRLGVVHRDVKPSNCFLTADGRVKIGDFGLAKSLTGAAHLTRTGAFIGTPLFASPEQVRGDRVDEQSDLYSLAATLYCLLSGKAPFETSDSTATLARIVSDDPPSLRGRLPDLPAALDRVVLRGLERERARRWHDLEAFRRALLPFVPGQLSFAGLGSRFGAYVLDVIIFFLAYFAALFAVGLALPDDVTALAFAEPVWGLLAVLYYAIPEGRWGWTPGKRLLGLRVRTARGFESPGLRALPRAASFYLTLNLGSLVVFFLLLRDQPFSGLDFARLYQEHFLVWLAATALPGAWYVLGAVLLTSTMRARNGYRGLHEFLSGTRVIALPPPSAVRRVTSRPLEADVTHREEWPERLGAFAVRGELRRDEASAVLLGESPTLGRQVLLWLRPDTEESLPGARHDLARATRLRWLANGRHEGWQWDAFLAPAGCPLADLVASAGRLFWADVRIVLDQLTGELIAAGQDGTLPASLTLDQVWVDTGGRVQLLDVPPGSGAGRQSLPPTGLLAEVVCFSLEGRRRAPDRARSPLAVPVALHARTLLDRLVGTTGRWKNLEEWQKALARDSERPSEVTRARRAAHVALLALFLSPGLIMFLLPSFIAVIHAAAYSAAVDVGEAALAALDEGATREFELSCVSPAPGARLPGLVQLAADRAAQARLEQELRHGREQRRRLRDSLSPVGRWYMDYCLQYINTFLEDASFDGADFRLQATRCLHISDFEDPWQGEGRVVGAFFLLAPPVFCVGWAFVGRGGLSGRILGLALVQADGRPAARWRCALRALLIWAPVATLFLTGLWAEVGYWAALEEGRSAPGLLWLAWAGAWSAWALLTAFAVLAIRSPVRGLHDRLAGTYLVPR